MSSSGGRCEVGDPFREAVLEKMEASFETLRRVVDGLGAGALNWEPAGEETNSIAVLTTHAMHSTRMLLHAAVGEVPPDRDRPAEFTAVVEGPGELLEMIDGLGAECAAFLGGAGDVDWGEKRRRQRSTGETEEYSAAALLLQAVVHLRGHADEASLTRHVWEARA